MPKGREEETRERSEGRGGAHLRCWCACVFSLLTNGDNLYMETLIVQNEGRFRTWHP